MKNIFEQKILKTTKITNQESIIACSYLICECLSKYYREKKERIDGRKFDELRNIEYTLSPLKNAHGSILFSRGNTQVLTTSIIGKVDEEIHEEDCHQRKMYAHYNFYGFANNEMTRSSTIKRRELGHGYIIENSINSVINKSILERNTIRIVTDVLSSDGSTSIAGAMSASLALKSLGIDNNLIIGIGIGCFKGENNQLQLIADISGIEDEFSYFDAKILMNDFKNIIYIQIDSKKTVITLELFEKILDYAYLKSDVYINQIQEPIKKINFTKHSEISNIKTMIFDSNSIRYILKYISLNTLQKQYNSRIEVGQGKISVLGSDKDIKDIFNILTIASIESKKKQDSELENKNNEEQNNIRKKKF